jgi:AcrR family transcriptional regulator
VKARLGRPPATDSAGTRRRILDVARVAFAVHGYDSSTNRNLGDEVGITAGALYHYFGSKLDLYIAVHDDVQEQVYSQFAAAVDSSNTFRGKLEAVLDTAHEMNKRDPSLAQFLGALRVDLRRNAELYEALRHTAAAREAFFDRIVDFGLATGEIDPENRGKVSALLLTLLIGLTDAVSGHPAKQKLAIEAIKDLLEGALIRPVAESRRTHE